jgi:plasmid maintenance system antidote protein VapI
MAIHIGKIIKETLKSKKMDVTAFSKKINYTRGNAYKIFNKTSIDTDLLIKISKVLGENLFFNFLTDDEITQYKNNKVKSGEVLDVLKDLKATVIAMNEERKKKERVKPKRKERK